MALSRSRTVAAIVLIVALALGAVSSAVLAPEANALASITTLTIVEGAVLIRHGDADFSPAHEGDVVAAGDTIRAGSGASAEMTYFEGTSVRIEAESALVVASLRTSESVLGTLEHTWSVITKLVSGSTRYDVRTPSSTASVRG